MTPLQAKVARLAKIESLKRAASRGERGALGKLRELQTPEERAAAEARREARKAAEQPKRSGIGWRQGRDFDLLQYLIGYTPCRGEGRARAYLVDVYIPGLERMADEDGEPPTSRDWLSRYRYDVHLRDQAATLREFVRRCDDLHARYKADTVSTFDYVQGCSAEWRCLILGRDLFGPNGPFRKRESWATGEPNCVAHDIAEH